MQGDGVLCVFVDTSPSVCNCVHRSQDIQLCILVIPDLAKRASRVVLAVSWVRDFPCAPPLERVILQSVPLHVPSPWAHHHRDLQLSPHVDIGCFCLRDHRLRQVWNLIFIHSTACTALSAAPFEPLLFTGEVRGVAAVKSAHAS